MQSTVKLCLVQNCFPGRLMIPPVFNINLLLFLSTEPREESAVSLQVMRIFPKAVLPGQEEMSGCGHPVRRTGRLIQVSQGGAWPLDSRNINIGYIQMCSFPHCKSLCFPQVWIQIQSLDLAVLWATKGRASASTGLRDTERTTATQGRQVKDGKKSLSESPGAAAGWVMSGYQHRLLERVTSHSSESSKHNGEKNQAKECTL